MAIELVGRGDPLDPGSYMWLRVQLAALRSLRVHLHDGTEELNLFQVGVPNDHEGNESVPAAHLTHVLRQAGWAEKFRKKSAKNFRKKTTKLAHIC